MSGQSQEQRLLYYYCFPACHWSIEIEGEVKRETKGGEEEEEKQEEEDEEPKKKRERGEEESVQLYVYLHIDGGARERETSSQGAYIMIITKTTRLIVQ